MKQKTIVAISLFFTLFLFSYLYSQPKGFTKDEYSLYKAVYMGRIKKAEKLLDKGVSPNVKSPNSKRTPLHIACAKGRIKAVKLLVERGAI